MLDIVVLGGSFNPPTLAHKAILRSTIDHIKAKTGIFVPSSHFYIKRKCSRTGKTPLPQEIRYRMLKSLCDTDMKIDTYEFGSKEYYGHTAKTLAHIQETYRGYTVWFIAGEDKLRVLPKFKLPDTMHYVIITRNNQDEASVKDHPFLTDKQERSVILTIPDADETSSSKVQDIYQKHTGEDPLKYVNQTTHNLMTAYMRQKELTI